MFKLRCRPKMKPRNFLVNPFCPTRRLNSTHTERNTTQALNKSTHTKGTLEQRKLENTPNRDSPTGHRLCVVAMTTLPSDMSDPTVGWKRLRPAHDLGEVHRARLILVKICSRDHYPPQSLTWNLKTMVSNRNFLFQDLIFWAYVSFRMFQGSLKQPHFGGGHS